MKPIKIDLSTDFEEIKVVPVGDYHLGDPYSDYKKIQADLEFIKNNDNVFCCVLGDIMNTATKSSVSDVYGDTLSPMLQLQECVKLFEPIREKILCVVPGNHERRIARETSIDTTALFANQLGLDDRYSPTTALVFLRFGHLNKGKNHGRKVCYTLHVSHGNGGGKKEGGKLQRLVDLAGICDADCYICGHTHLPAILKERFIRPNCANSSLTYCDKLYVNVSAKLNYGGYGDYGGFKVANTDTPVIILNGCKKEMKAVL